ncbi:myrosinase 1-like [Aricia agestis]|uniref:myrosinase 1-like n=1 Tax=Aricia agestis TaxID=91739 RepID=UPI001C2066A4|nr:myrosinase 1-like [Aricia agestis]
MYLHLQSVFIIFVVGSVWSHKNVSELKFPPWFKFGAATAAYQIEGGWNISDKSPSIWDVFTHESPGMISDGGAGDEACDSYRLWREDVKIVADLGLDFYRFSISWPRLLPSGFPDRISSAGRRYYSELIDGLLAAGVEPVVTVYHWDLPQSLQDLGGWTNPLISDWFADYARVVFSLYADRVKTWITINEPVIYCDASYTMGVAPKVQSPEIGLYLCKKHALIAHAKAWRIYDKEFKPKYHGKVSLSNLIMWFEPDDDGEEEVAELARQYGGGMYSHPIYSKEGGWPPAIEQLIAKRSLEQGYPRSRLPAFTEHEIQLTRGTYDFYGLNYYTARLTRRARSGERIGIWPFSGISELNITFTTRPEWKKAPPFWFYIYPEGLRHLMTWLRDQYGDMEFFITETGVSDYDGRLHDVDRVEYYQKHLEQVLLSIHEDHVNVTGFTAWTLMDDFEWIDGYRSKFGLYAVDFSDQQRRRTPRTSAVYYRNVVHTGSITPPKYSPYSDNGVTNKIFSCTNLYSLIITVYYVLDFQNC